MDYSDTVFLGFFGFIFDIVEEKKIFLIDTFFPLHVDVRLRPFIRWSCEFIFTVAGDTGISKFYRTFVVIDVHTSGSIILVWRFRVCFRKWSYWTLPESMQFVDFVALGNRLEGRFAQIIHCVWTQSSWGRSSFWNSVATRIWKNDFNFM